MHHVHLFLNRVGQGFFVDDFTCMLIFFFRVIKGGLLKLTD